MVKRFDVVIVGAGPIGSYTAYQLADKGFAVCLLDKKERIGENVICAGVIGKEAFKKYDLPSDSILSRIDSFTFISPWGQRLEYYHPDVFAYVVSRKRFDKGLFKLAQRFGVSAHLNQRVTKIVEAANYNTVVCGKNVYQGKFVVLATGVEYALQTKMGMGSPPQFLFGSQIELPKPINPSNIEIHLGQHFAPGSFGWIVPVNHKFSKIGVIVAQRGKHWLLQMLKDRFNVGIKQDGVKIKPIAFGAIKKSVHNKILAVGEAAGQTKTTTGGGIFYGLLCSEIAVDKLHRSLKNNNNSLNDYEVAWQSALSSEFNIGMKLRKVAGSIDDETIERLFSFVKRNRFWVQLLLPRINFDYHSNMLFFCLESFRHLFRIPFPE